MSTECANLTGLMNRHSEFPSNNFWTPGVLDPGTPDFSETARSAEREFLPKIFTSPGPSAAPDS